MERNIDHFLHEHPLTLMIEEEVNHESRCHGCRKSLSSGPIYGCSECEVYLDKACAELPKEIQHFFHPCPLFLSNPSFDFACNACFKSGSGLRYDCRECRAFSMHVECAQRPNIKSNGDGDSEKIIQHFTHWHPLRLVDGNQKKDLQVGCGLCEKLICFDSASATAYGCEECNFFVHKPCMINLPQQINHHFFHPSCTLILQTIPNYYKCEGCDDDHVSALAFRCRQCYFHIDVKCALLPTLDQSKDAHKIQYVGHKHPLVALPHNNNKDKNCILCGEKGLDEDPCFCCERCQYFFIHEGCAVISSELKAEIRHYFHPLHPLTLTFRERRRRENLFPCGACLGLIDRFVPIYRCDKCRFDIHFYCAIKHKQLLVKYEGHSHPLAFFDKMGECKYCDICHQNACNCIFRCVACDFNIHLHCHPSTPKSIRHKCHLHPLTLTQSPFEFELVSPQYRDKFDQYWDAYHFYCDICEEKRFEPESVYYCPECKFIAETRCVISELLPSFSGLEDHLTSASSRADHNSALEAYVAELKEKKRPLKSEIKKLKATLEALEAEFAPLSLKLKEAKKDFLISSLLIK